MKRAQLTCQSPDPGRLAAGSADGEVLTSTLD